MSGPAHRAVRLVEWAGCFVTGTVFLLAGIPKILNPALFATTIFQQKLLPGLFTNLTAIYLPWLEIACGLALIFVPAARRGALWVASILLAIFTLSIGLNMLRGGFAPCGCFGSLFPDAALPPWAGLLRNVALMAFTSAALLAQSFRAKPYLPPRRGSAGPACD
ncbi:MAG: MauE/DoxX family redox-associated membrane protein [Terrimicrobiaceae bacterium]